MNSPSLTTSPSVLGIPIVETMLRREPSGSQPVLPIAVRLLCAATPSTFAVLDACIQGPLTARDRTNTEAYAVCVLLEWPVLTLRPSSERTGTERAAIFDIFFLLNFTKFGCTLIIHVIH